jgi:hypothetical protein
MFVAGQGPAAIAKALRCSRMQVYRVLGDGAPEKLKNEPVPSVEAASSRPKVERVPLNKPPVKATPPKVTRPRMNKPVVASEATRPKAERVRVNKPPLRIKLGRKRVE